METELKQPTAREIARELERRSEEWLKQHDGQNVSAVLREVPDAVLMALAASHLARHLDAAHMFRMLTEDRP